MNQNRRFRRPAAQAEPVAESPDANEKEYYAPTVGLEDKIFTIGTTVDAAKFEMVKKELANTLLPSLGVMKLVLPWYLRHSQNHHI